MDVSKTNKSIGAGAYGLGLKRGHSFSLGLYPTVFQAAVYAIRAM
jgi:hypothetical protein